jgi:hypothetical protein
LERKAMMDDSERSMEGKDMCLRMNMNHSPLSYYAEHQQVHNLLIRFSHFFSFFSSKKS